MSEIERLNTNSPTPGEISSAIEEAKAGTIVDYAEFQHLVDPIAPVIGYLCIKNFAKIEGIDGNPVSDRGTYIMTGWLGAKVPVRCPKTKSEISGEYCVPVLARDAIQPFKEMSKYLVYEDLYTWWQEYYRAQSNGPISLPEDGIPNTEFLYFRGYTARVESLDSND